MTAQGVTQVTLGVDLMERSDLKGRPSPAFERMQLKHLWRSGTIDSATYGYRLAALCHAEAGVPLARSDWDRHVTQALGVAR